MLTFTKKDDKRVEFHANNIEYTAELYQNDAGESRMRLKGMAIVYNQLSDDRGGYFVRIAPGSARFTNPVLALYSHDYANVLGNTQNNTLTMQDTPDGIGVTIDLPDTQLARDVYELVQKRYINGMSFGTVPLKTKLSKEGDKEIVTYEEMLVDEVTITGIPAFTSTSITALEQTKDEAKEDAAKEVDVTKEKALQALQLLALQIEDD